MKYADFSEPEQETAARKIFSVNQVNRDARVLLETRFSQVWVEGEISNLKKHTSGHIYLSLKDDKAQISAVFFSGYNRAVRFDMRDGLQVLVMGKLSLYEPRGQYQFFIERMEPKGLGALQLAFNQLKEKLYKEGLFSPELKRPIPRFPKTVGIVTSPTGAAIRDILNVMTRRFSGVHILLMPVLVQGPGSAQQIARAIDEMNEQGEADVLIVGRGGGSLEDLWAFNEEIVARAIRRSRIPVISAVGHEIDWTIADFVSDLRAPTPSAAAELVVQNSADLERRVRELQMRMVNAAKGKVRDADEKLQSLEQSYAFKQPKILMEQFSQRLDEFFRQLQNYMKARLGESAQTFQTLAGRLNALSPLGILERGYSLTFQADGSLLKDAAKVQKGDKIETQLHRGKIISTVTEIKG